MRITSAGNVGIGTTTPAYKFQTASSVNSDWVGSFYNTSTTNPNGLQVRVGVSSSAQALGVYTDGVGYTFNVLGNGNCLIGTTTDAGYKLDVNGTARIKSTGYGVVTTLYDTSNNGFQFIADGFSGYNAINSTSQFLLQISGSERMRVTSSAATFNGNIGWGAVTPIGDGSNCSTIEGTNGAQIAARNGFAQLYIGSNVVGTPYAATRSVAGYATQLSLDALGGTISLNRAVSGAAGSAISWINVLGFDNAGKATFTESVTIGNKTTTQINALTPVAGMVVFNTTLAVLCFYDGTGWKRVVHLAM